ncbi:hypothetical protein IWW37_000560 [Coemansia sp. RSA 2050]|nr:hypothetical protein IWW37_000560 [Coemansia sp. RSA 2050]
MYYYQIYIGLAHVVAPKAQKRALNTSVRTVNIFDSNPPAQTRGSHQLQQQAQDLGVWLQHTIDYRFGRVQIEWCSDILSMSSGGSGSAEGAAGVFEQRKNESSMACEVGILRLYRSTEDIPDTLVELPGEANGETSDERPTVLAVLAVPGYMTPTDFLSFAGSFRDSIEHVRVVRDRFANHYMILLKLRDAIRAAEFYAYYSGKTFSPLEPETCHVVYVSAVECELREIRGSGDGALFDEATRRVCTQPAALFLQPIDPQAEELPTCPVCLERLDASASGLLTTLCQHTFHCRCLQRWGDGTCPVCRYTQTSPFVDQERFLRTVGSNSPAASAVQTISSPPSAAATVAEGSGAESNCCSVCGRTGDLWICLVCGTIGCGRYVNGHAKDHFNETQHPYSMELQSQCVWDYVGDGYVHRLLQNTADRKVIALDAMTPSAAPPDRPQRDHQTSFVEAREKLDAVTQEYEILLTSQLESQREHYEMQIARLIHHHTQRPNHADAMSQSRLAQLEQRLAAQQTAHQAEVQRLAAEREAERRESATERSRLEAAAAKSLKKAAEDARLLEEEKAMSRQLAVNQDALTEQIDTLNAAVTDLQEQVRDLTFFITTHDTIKAGGGSAELEGASVIAVANRPSPTTPARGKGKGRRGGPSRR